MQCSECQWWKVDRGIHCMNGWTGDGSEGHCHYEVIKVFKKADDYCHNWKSKNE